jgi:hypothetical protein
LGTFKPPSYPLDGPVSIRIPEHINYLCCRHPLFSFLPFFSYTHGPLYSDASAAAAETGVTTGPPAVAKPVAATTEGRLSRNERMAKGQHQGSKRPGWRPWWRPGWWPGWRSGGGRCGAYGRRMVGLQASRPGSTCKKEKSIEIQREMATWQRYCESTNF